MKTFVLSLLMLLTLPALATTWYVRPDGGSRFSPDNPQGQCNGKTDAAYPGSGSNRNCALNDPRYLYSTGGNQPYSWIISGGDTVLMRGGPYRIGGSTSADCPAFSNGCASDNSFIPAPPPGTDAQPTRLLGENYASCSAKTQLYGGYTVNAVFDLRGTHDVQVQCFDITDHSQCSVMGDRHPSSCTGTLADDLAKSGILTDNNTHDITLQDLDIHGFRSNGISGPVGGVINANRVRIAFNGSAGWNFDDGLGHHSVNGQMNWTSVLFEGNGCIEEYPITHAFPAVFCYDDGNGGYGDAVGTNDDQINFNVDHSTFRYNTQDGLDLLHDRGANITVTNSSFYGNMGQQLKLGPMASTVVRNNLFLTNCKRLSADMPGAPAGYNAELSDFCRASAAVIMVQRGDNAGGGSYIFQNNSFVGYTGDAMLETGECTDSFVSALTNDCNTPNIVYQNNLMVGYPYPINAYRYTGLPPSGMGTESGAQSRFAARDHNIYYNTYSCPAEPGSSCGDPHLAGEPVFTGNTPLPETAFDAVNFALTSASTNAIGQGITIPGLTSDFNGTPRSGPGTIGALVYGGSAPPPAPAPGPSTLTPQFSLAVTPNPLPAGQPAVISVTAAAVNGLVPTGTVAFSVNGSRLQASLASGVASVSIPGMSPGAYTVAAAYSGDGVFAASAAGSSTLTVNSAPSAVAISVAEPPYGFNLIPGSTRRLFATVTNGTTNQVRWSVVRGSATVSAVTGPWVDLTAPPSGSSCQYGKNSISSGTQFTVEAQAADDPSKVSDVTINVCNPTVQISVLPGYRMLYSGQTADLQSLIVGSTDTEVRWSLASQPQGGDGRLLDTGLRDTVFTATRRGRYYITATSVADPRQTATAILFITGDTMPYSVTPLGTEPVDCSVDPDLQGGVFDVGPSLPFSTIGSVPLASLGPGSTIRIFNQDTTGAHPTEYHEFLQIAARGTTDQPIRLCGVPDRFGNLPILDGSKAVGVLGANGAPGGVVTVHNNDFAATWPNLRGPSNVTIEGLQIRNVVANSGYLGTDGTLGHWTDQSACVAITEGSGISIIGNDLSHCSSGGHSAWVGSNGWGAADLNTLWEGNHFHGNGVPGSDAGQQLSLEAWGEVVQFNRFDSYEPGARGADLKSRGIGDVIRYNYFGDGAVRQLDLVDVHDALPFLSFAAPLSSPVDDGSYPADQVAAEQEVAHTQFVYGNYLQDSTSVAPVRFSEDGSGGEGARTGSLFWYHNTYLRNLCSGCSAQPWAMFDTSAAAGDAMPQVEFGNVQLFDNLLWLDRDSAATFSWNTSSGFIATAGLNLLPQGWGTDNMNGGPGTGWTDSGLPYQGAQNLASHLPGFDGGHLLTVAAQPFDTGSGLLAVPEPAGDPAPRATCEMPARFSYLPSLGIAVPRLDAPNLGAADTTPQAIDMFVTGAGLGRSVNPSICY